MAGHARDSKRERFWRKALARRASSGLTVKEFCAQEGLVATTYQHWRRELTKRAKSKSTVTQKLRGISSAPRRRSQTATFLPIQLTEDGGGPTYPFEVNLCARLLTRRWQEIPAIDLAATPETPTGGLDGAGIELLSLKLLEFGFLIVGQQRDRFVLSI